MASASTINMPPTTILFQGSSNTTRAVGIIILGALSLYIGSTINAAFCFVVGILLLISTKGIELDTTAHKHRLFTALAGFKIGSWKRTPDVQGIIMKCFSDSATSSNAAYGKNQPGQRYIVMFSVPESSQGIIVHQTEKYEAANHLTETLAQVLGVEAKMYDKFGTLQ
jgi:predicted Abi (CAAX) family protease